MKLLPSCLLLLLFSFIFLVLPFLANIRYLSSVECDCNTSIQCICLRVCRDTYTQKWCEKLICQYCHTCASVLFIHWACVFFFWGLRSPPSSSCSPIQSPKSLSVETDALFLLLVVVFAHISYYILLTELRNSTVAVSWDTLCCAVARYTFFAVSIQERGVHKLFINQSVVYNILV